MGACSTRGRDKKCIQNFGIPELRRSFGRPRHRWEDNIKMDLREIVWKVVAWLHLVQGRNQWQALVNVVMNFEIP